jgi:peptidoglycan-associated lipoprotein
MRAPRLTLPAIVALCAGCAHATTPPQSPTGGGSVAVAATPAPAATSNSGNAVSMSGDLRRVCGIEDTGAAPKFDFDSAVLSPTDRSELDQLAQCMTTGSLAGKNVELVGRADPRGEAEYNMTLGETRASAVKHYVAELGIAGSRIRTTSRGALDAQGHDEASWALDRRVDLRLAGR